MDFNHFDASSGEFDDVIGEELFLGSESPENYRGIITKLETGIVDGYGHEQSFIVTNEINHNTGDFYRFRVNKLINTKPKFGEITTTKFVPKHEHRRDRKCIACATGNAKARCWNCGCLGPDTDSEFGEICEGCHGEFGVVR
jgi:hypothetical protein